MAGSVNARWRRDEFADTFKPKVFDNEPHTIELIDEVGKFGFFSNESLELTEPSSVTVVEDNTAALPFQETTDPPDSEEFRVSYDAETFENTGFIECNAADDGREVILSGRGLGTINHPNFRLNRDFFLPGSAQVEEDLTVQRDLFVERDSQLDSALNVDGVTTLDETEIDGTLDVNGDSTFDGDVEINTGKVRSTETSDPDSDNQFVRLEFLRKMGLSQFLAASDLTLNGAEQLKQRIVYCKNLTVTANTTIRSRVVFVNGDLTIDPGVELNIEPVFLNTIPNNHPVKAPSEGGTTVVGANDSTFGEVSSSFGASTGDAGISFVFSIGGGPPAIQNSVAGGLYPGAFGGAGGAGGGAQRFIPLPTGSNSGGAGGGGIGQGGGGGFSFVNDGGGGKGGDGGELCFFLITGSVVIGAGSKITANGGSAIVPNAEAGNGGGSGGGVVIFAQGDFENSGSIEAKGSDGTNGVNGSEADAGGGGGGGGGHVEIYAKTAILTAGFGTIDVSPGAGGVGVLGGNNGDAGSSGTIFTIETEGTTKIAGGGSTTPDQEKFAGALFQYLEGIFF